MGSCVSTDNITGAVDQVPTAKIITLAGDLREYSFHLTAADALAGDSASCFLCNSDKLFCDAYIPQLDAGEVLRPGQLYFVLPGAKLRYPLTRSDMKELVVRASAALQLASKNDGQKKRKEKKYRIVPELLEADGGGSGMDEIEKFDDKVKLGRPPVTVHRRMKRCGSLRGRVGFRSRCSSGSRLSTIQEVVG